MAASLQAEASRLLHTRDHRASIGLLCRFTEIIVMWQHLTQCLNASDPQTEILMEDFPGGPVAKTVLPVQGAWVKSLVRELDPTCRN